MLHVARGVSDGIMTVLPINMAHVSCQGMFPLHLYGGLRT